MRTRDGSSVLDVGRRVRVIREAAEQSQSEFARAIGVEPSTVGNWEQGRSRPNAENIRAIAEHYRVTGDYILWGSTFGLMHGVASNLAKAEERISSS